MTFNPELILSDEEFCDISYCQNGLVQSFLEKHNSFLKDYKINDKLVSWYISNYCLENSLNPKIVLTNAQKEQGLISSTKIPSQHRMDWAFSVGATDNGYITKWKGFDNQVLGTILLSKRLYNKFKNPIEFTTGENKVITIKNAATYSLYKYCPWIGNTNKQIGKNLYKSPFGNYLFYLVYSRYFL